MYNKKGAEFLAKGSGFETRTTLEEKGLAYQSQGRVSITTCYSAMRWNRTILTSCTLYSKLRCAQPD
jgi:hypothetical protein